MLFNVVAQNNTRFTLFAKRWRFFLLVRGLVDIDLLQDDPLGDVDDGPHLDAIVEQVAAVLHLFSTKQQALLFRVDVDGLRDLLPELLDQHGLRDLKDLDSAVRGSNFDLHDAITW